MTTQPTVHTTDIPRSEHPRPDFERADWQNLNGSWRFTFDKNNEGEQKRWHRQSHHGDSQPSLGDPFIRTINVPFPWESPLSDIHATDYHGAAWYQRMITVSENWQGAPWLCFGAVDWSAKVWINGRFVGEHHGGYTPFAFDINRFIQPGVPATLTVRVWDNCDADTLLGKQTLDWYTPSSGIWQTVWLEARPTSHLETVQITPNIENGTANFAVKTSGGSGTIRISSPEGSFDTVETQLANNAHMLVTINDVQLWTPETPHLYDAVIEIEADGQIDRVKTYFGMRSVGKGTVNGNMFEYFLLNGEPIYLRGALDQAFTPQGLHTYPSDDAIRADIQLAKDLGLNMLRCHIKLNEPRYYYWADKLGMAIWYDIPCALLYDDTARRYWEEAFDGAIARDFNHPSILAWILFNETWGLEEHNTWESWFWVADRFDHAKRVDPTRLIEDNSPCNYDHVVTDINTWHFYIPDYARSKQHIETVVDSTYEGSTFNYVSGKSGLEKAKHYKQGVEPLLNSEYAGLGASGGDKDISRSFQFLTTLLRRYGKICGYVYTELTDIEWEHNGFVNYDRSAKEFGYDSFVAGMTVADLNGADFVGWDTSPCVTIAPGNPWSAAAFVSHWDRQRDLTDAYLAWHFDFTDTLGDKRTLTSGKIAIAPRRYDVQLTEPVTITVPDENGLGTMALLLVDKTGTTIARNFVNIDIYSADAPHPATSTHLAVTLVPGDYTACSWSQPMVAHDMQKFSGWGVGWVEYNVPVASLAQLGTLSGITVLFEAASMSAGARIGWRRPWMHGVSHYPQTHIDHKIASEITVAVNGIEIGKATLPDDPADTRGVLSLHNSAGHDFASYGFLTTINANSETVKQIADTLKDEAVTIRFSVPAGSNAHGIQLYGARSGAYPVAPTVIFTKG